MRRIPSRWCVLTTIFLAFEAFATVRYVNVNSTNPTAPYTSWATASTDIQDAIDASTNGDLVLVTNGVYATGGRAFGGISTNRVILTSALTVQSVNGPLVTIIQDAGGAQGLNAVRCAWLTNNATLIGFTLEGGRTNPNGAMNDTSGGGVWCASSSAVVDNCVIVSNIASYEGSGAYQGTLNNCLISGNGSIANGSSGAYNGGGAFGSVLNSCTIISNATASGFAVQQCAMTNCIVYYNNGPQSSAANYFNPAAAAYCCTIPLPSGPWPGNFIAAPQIFADGVHLLTGSPCIGAGTNLVTGTDIFGNAWSNPPSIGCAEFNPSPLVAPPSINLLGNPAGFTVSALASGAPTLSLAWFKDGVLLQNNGPFSAAQTTNLVLTGVSLAEAGNYQLVASNSFGVATSGVTTLTIHCVNASGLNPVSPYSTWSTAATNIQDAITASANGDIVLVTNGLYQFGAQSMDGVSTNRISLNKAVRVQSVNGPAATTIQGGGVTSPDIS